MEHHYVYPQVIEIRPDVTRAASSGHAPPAAPTMASALSYPSEPISDAHTRISTPEHPRLGE
jgi:hypothetical protein